MEIIKALATKNLCYIAAQKMVPQGIVIHSTGVNNPNLRRYVDCAEKVGINKYNNHWNNAKPGGKKVCVHAFVGYDKDKNVCVAQILPLDICCWGVGKGKKGSYNYDPAYIQIEICEDNLTDGSYYKQAFDVAAQYCALLCKRFNIELSNIVGHCEAHKRGYGSNHSDPEHWMKRHGQTMQDFRNAVEKLLCKNEEPLKVEKRKEDKERFPYRVKVVSTPLNIRKAAGTNSEKVGCIKQKGVYTIVQESKGTGAKLWGKLKSGAGWIALDYTKKC